MPRSRSSRGATRPYLAVLVSSSWWVVNLRPLAMSRSARVVAKLRLSSYLLFFCETQRENPSNLSRNQCVFPLYCHGISVSFFTPSDRKSTRLNSSHLGISYAVFCL